MLKGSVVSQESKLKMRLAKLGKPSPKKGIPTGCVPKSAFKKGVSPWNKGTKGLISAWNKGKSNTWCIGDKNVNWKGGITPANKALRESRRYEQWRAKVFKRDKYTCRECGQVGGRLQADHIKMWAIYPELRFRLSNGQTLCFKCHRLKTNEDIKINWKNQYKSNYQIN